VAEARAAGVGKFELLPIETGFGLTCLPEPSDGDVFFDLEGDPFVGEHGLEYLFGYVFRNAGGALVYEGEWALTRADEKRAFERFADFVMARWAQFHGLHIYHYAPYEPAALKRLMGRYATREEEIDRMLRARLFRSLSDRAAWSARQRRELLDQTARAVLRLHARNAARRCECRTRQPPS
jgi:predicted RecB family nuclease